MIFLRDTIKFSANSIRVLKNALARLFSQVSVRLISLALVGLVARYTKAEGLGAYLFVLSIVAIVGAVNDFGLNTYLTREAARASDDENQVNLFNDTFLIKTGFSILGFIFILLVSRISIFPITTKQLLSIGGFLLIPEAMLGALAALINARQRMDITGGLQITERAFTLIISVVLLDRGLGVLGVLIGSSIAKFIIVIMYFFILQRWQMLPKFNWPVRWQSHLKEAFPFGLMMGVSALYARVDLILLNLWQGELATGWYGAAYKLWGAFNILPSSILFALFPELSRLSSLQKGRSIVKQILKTGKWMMPLAGVGLAILGSVWARELVSLIFNDAGSYTSSQKSFRIMVWAFPGVFLSMLYSHALYAVGRQSQVLKVMSLTLLFNLAANLIVIPYFSYLGTSMVTVLSEYLLAGLLLIQITRFLSADNDSLRKLHTGGYVSAQAAVVDIDEDGQPEIIVGSDALYAWRTDGALLPGFPAKGGNYFASRPTTADLTGDGHLEILVGCDDNGLYVFDVKGKLISGWPQFTAGDVYSSPLAADIDNDGNLEVLVGSDDGHVYIWRADGSLYPGWPQQTAGFVSASPLLYDMDGDGRKEILVGSWDEQVHIWKLDGDPLSGWPQKTGHSIWSAPAVGDIDADGAPEVITASDKVYAWRQDGTMLPGWPQSITSYCVSSPVLYDINQDGNLEIILAADKLYIWRADGEFYPGYPVDLDSYLWASPTIIPGDPPQIAVAGWNGELYIMAVDGTIKNSFTTTGPIFATPTVAKINGIDNVVIGSWDQSVYIFPLDALIKYDIQRNKQIPKIYQAGDFNQVKAFIPPFICFPGPVSNQATMYYKADIETDWHPVPLMVHRGYLTGIIQPFLAGARVEYYAKINDMNGKMVRYPAKGYFRYTVQQNWPDTIFRRFGFWDGG